MVKCKGIWELLDAIGKAPYDDSPWCLMLNRLGCFRDSPPALHPLPCVWRRPVSGAVSRREQREHRWDWRSCRAERAVRLALQHRDDFPVDT